MLIIPIGHERGTVLRLPWVTFTIMAICVLVFLWERGAVGEHEERAEEAYYEAQEYYFEHPDLDPPAELLEGDYLSERAGEGLAEELYRTFGDNPEPTPQWVIERDQKELDALVASWRQISAENPLRKWGLVPADYGLVQLITHMFLHGGWLHLLGNLFILYLAAPAIEDVWGRPLFATFYLGAGIFAGLAYAVGQGDSQVPCVGASGAIAAVMGAFLVRYWKVKIKFFYFLWVFLRVFSGTFQAPAWLMLPLWFLGEWWSAYTADYFAGLASGSVAYWAHVWGFVGGALLAGTVQFLGLEKKLISGKIEEKIGLLKNEELESAYESIRVGDSLGARRQLEELLRKRPGDRDAALALWDVGLRLKEPQGVVAPMLRCIWEELASGDHELGLQHLGEVVAHVPQVELPPNLLLKVAEALLAQHREEEASGYLERLFASERPLPAALLLRVARLVEDTDPALSRRAVDSGLAIVDLHPETVGELAALAERLPPTLAASSPTASPGDGASSVPAPMAPGERPLLIIAAGTPEQIGTDRITLQLEGKGRVGLPFDKICAVGAAHLLEPGYQPYSLIDLFIDPLTADAERVRLVRFLTSQFEPLALVPAAPTADAATVALVELLVRSSGSRLYPVAGSAVGSALPRFAAIEEYEAAMRQALRRAPPEPVDASGIFGDLPELPPPPSSGGK